MELLDRYLQTVKVFLPRGQQDDIIRELSEEIRSQIEEQETDAGRLLTEAEREQVVQHYGHPAVLAGRYTQPRHLIGPEVFPLYWFVLKLAFACAAIAYVVLAVISIAGGGTIQRTIAAVAGFPLVVLIQFAGITLVFAARERYRTLRRWLDRWSPRDLPSAAAAPGTGWTRPIANLTLSAAFILWWMAVPRFPFLMFGTNAGVLTLAPAWSAMYWPVAVVALIGFALKCLGLCRPRWTRFHSIAHTLMVGAGLVILGFLLRAGEVVSLSGTVQHAARDSWLVAIVNSSVLVGLTIATMVVALLAMLQLRVMAGVQPLMPASRK